MDFSLYGIEVDELVEGVTQFKYLGIPLDQSDNDCPDILRYIRRAHKVWVGLVSYCGGRGQIARFWGVYIGWWCKWFCCSDQNHGPFHR